MKGSYRIGRLLKRFVPNGFGDTFQSPEISPPATQQAEEYYSENRRAPVLKSLDPLNDKDPDSEKQRYLTYQKNMAAGRVVPESRPPKSPGKILKLPLADDQG